MRAFLPDAYESVGMWGRRCWGRFCLPVGPVGGGLGAMFLVLDGALVEGQANGVNAIAKIRRGIETLTSKHVA